MNIIPQAVASYEVAKTISGKYKPNLKNKRKAYIALGILIMLGLTMVIMGTYQIFHGDISTGLVLFFSAFADFFLIGISPWIQNPNNYRFEIEENEPIENLRIFYKGKPVIVDFIINEEGKVEFADDNKKHACIRWADGSHMSQFTTYRILNAFAKHMSDINLLSDNVTSTFE